jgi:hypothetical protein
MRRAIHLFLALGLSAATPVRAHPHSLAELLQLPIDRLMQLEYVPLHERQADTQASKIRRPA